MKDLYKAFCELNLDSSGVGLSREEGERYFCTPIGAEIFGWDNGIHYCFIDDFGETVFCVNPETCCDYYTYPVARNFTDFLSLLLAVRTTNTMQQVICWDKKTFENFVSDPTEIKADSDPEIVYCHIEIREKLGIAPIENPFEYIKELQKDFPYQKIRFTDEFYDATGIERIE